MTPEQIRARVEHVAKMARQGIIAEPPEDRAEWRREREAAPKVARTSGDRAERGKKSDRRTA